MFRETVLRVFMAIGGGLLTAITANALDGHFPVKDLPKEQVPVLVSAAIDRLPFRAEEVRTTPQAWPGPVAEPKASFTRVVARFKDVTSRTVESFDLIFEFLPEQIRISVTLPATTGTTSFTLPRDRSPAKAEYLAGAAKHGLAILIPERDVEPNAPFGAIICPRYEYKYRTGKTYEEALVESPYRLVRGLFLVDASVKGELQGAELDAAILTTSNISRSVPSQRSGQSSVALQYDPDVREMLPGNEADEAVTGAVQATLTGQKGDGTIIRVSADEVAWLREFKLANEQAWFAPYKHRELRVAPGICYVLWHSKNVLTDGAASGKDS